MHSIDVKNITKESYQVTSNQFADNVAGLAPIASIEKFLKLMPSNASIIDIGCGSGRDAKLFTEMGASVLGIDFSKNLVDIAQQTAPLASFQLMDIEAMDFSASSFNGVWAACSLGHISKNTLPMVFNKIHAILKDEGIFYLTLKEGRGEVLEQDVRYEGNIKKFVAYYQAEELEEVLQTAQFKILDLALVEKNHSYQTHSVFRVFCQKA